MKGKTTLLVDSGATKAIWALVRCGAVSRVRTAGINASVMSEDEILAIITAAAAQLNGAVDGDFKMDEVQGKETESVNSNCETSVVQNRVTAVDVVCKMGDVRNEVEEIRFYGAGLASKRAISAVERALKSVFPNATVECGSDLLAAAKAAFGEGEGIVAILGTGSNSGLYDGKALNKNVRSGGFILGDEGSGCALGKAFLADWVKGLLPISVREKFEDRYGLEYGDLVDSVYSGEAPSSYLASFAPFILSFAKDSYIQAMAEKNIRSFIERSLLQYDLSRYELCFVGSFALACREVIEKVAPDYGLKIKGFIADPIEELIKNLQSE